MNQQQFSTKPIGGYMALEIPDGVSYHPSLIALNTARNALEYLLRIKGYRLIYLPYFTCEAILEPLKKLNIDFKFYKLDEDLDPIIDFQIQSDSCLLYTNYFGIKTSTVKWLSSRIKNLIIDNAQAFYSAPVKNIDTFYSCRKFFGVPDGAYLYTADNLEIKLKVDQSFSRFSHLIKSIDINIEEGYEDYVSNNALLRNNEIKKMSILTERLLSGIDYEQCARIRKNNFNYLHKHLQKINMLRINLASEEIPMVYPLLVDFAELKHKLIENKIFIATYWPNVFKWTNPDSFEYFLSQNLISLPIDQRYNLNDMRRILTILNLLL